MSIGDGIHLCGINWNFSTDLLLFCKYSVDKFSLSQAIYIVASCDLVFGHWNMSVKRAGQKSGGKLLRYESKYTSAVKPSTEDTSMQWTPDRPNGLGAVVMIFGFYRIFLFFITNPRPI